MLRGVAAHGRGQQDEATQVAAGLMIGGIALLGTVTASIAAWLISCVRQEDEAVEAVTRADLRLLSEKIDDLRALVTETRRASVEGVAVGSRAPDSRGCLAPPEGRPHRPRPALDREDRCWVANLTN